MNRKQIKTSFVRNEAPGYDGVACIAALVGYFGRNVLVVDLLIRHGDINRPINVAKLVELARREGLDAKGFKGNIEILKTELGSPAVLYVTRDSGEDDFIVLYGWQNNRFIMGDPGWGIIEYTESELNSVWRSRVFISIEAGSSFRTTKGQQIIKRQVALRLVQNEVGPFIVVAFCGAVLAFVLIAVVRFFLVQIGQNWANENHSIVLDFSIELFVFIVSADILRRIGCRFSERGVHNFKTDFQQIFVAKIMNESDASFNFTAGKVVAISSASSRLIAAAFSVSYKMPLFALFLIGAVCAIGRICVLLSVGVFIALLLFVFLVKIRSGITAEVKRRFDLMGKEIDFVSYSYANRRIDQWGKGSNGVVDAIARLFDYSFDGRRNFRKEYRAGVCLELSFYIFFAIGFLSFIFGVCGGKLDSTVIELGVWEIVYLFCIYNLKYTLEEIIEIKTTFNFLYEVMFDERR